MDSKHKDDLSGEKTDAEVDVDDVSLCLLDLAVRDEEEDGEDHADDGYGEAKVGNVGETNAVDTALTDEVLVDVEDEGEVGEVVAGALGVGGVVTDSGAAIL